MGAGLHEVAESARAFAVAASDVPDVATRAARLAERSAEGRFHVAVLGEFKRGKSTVVNALVGSPVLPTGVIPCTSVTTEVQPGGESATVVRLDETRERVAIGQIADFVTEAANPQNQRGVGRVEVAIPAPLLASGLVIVDTPGVGSVHEHNTETARRAMADADGAILVLAADAPFSRNEHELLDVLARRGAPVFVVVNRCDVVDRSDLGEIRAFVVEHVGRVLDAPDVFLVSARSALAAKTGDAEARDPGEFPIFEAALDRFVHDELLVARIATAIHELNRMADDVEERLRIQGAALRLRSEELAARLLEFERTARDERRFLDDDLHLLHRDVERIGEEVATRLTRSAQWAAIAGRAAIANAADTADSALEEALSDELRRQVHEHMEEIRRESRAWLETEWSRCASAVRDRVQGRLDALRVAAGRLFDVELVALEVPTVEEQPDRFSFLFLRVGSSTEGLETLGRRLLPTTTRRRRALARAARELRRELDKHAGRARAALCEQLVGAEIQYRKTLMDELDAFVTAVREAAARAEQRRAEHDAEASRHAEQHRRVNAAVAWIRELKP